MRIAITGSSGLIGTALRARLAARGDEARRVRRGRASAPETDWDPARGWFRPDALEGVDAVVSLAGASIGQGRWTAARKREMVSSRVDGTRLLVDHLAGLRQRPNVLVSASAVGYYGSRGDTQLTEDSPRGQGFLADLVERWEAETARAAASGIRTVMLRFGVVLARDGGALPRMLFPFRLGLGGRLGSGRQWLSWVALEDAVGAILHAIDTPGLSGPVDVTAQPVTNREFTATLGRVLRRPAVLPLPTFALKAALGPEAANELLLASQRVTGRRLAESGYRLAHPEIDEALRSVLRS